MRTVSHRFPPLPGNAPQTVSRCFLPRRGKHRNGKRSGDTRFPKIWETVTEDGR